MKVRISILLIFLMMLPFIIKVSIFIDFKINQDFIAKVLCIKKEVPSNGCQGNCHLNKQLSKTEENTGSEELPRARVQKIKIEVICNKNNEHSLKQEKQTTKYFEIPTFYTAPNIFGLDHPPKFIVSIKCIS